MKLSKFFISFLAEQRLTSYEYSIPNFPSILLALTSPETISKANLPNSVRMPAVLLLKNLIKKYWAVHKPLSYFDVLLTIFRTWNLMSLI